MNCRICGAKTDSYISIDIYDYRKSAKGHLNLSSDNIVCEYCFKTIGKVLKIDET